MYGKLTHSSIHAFNNNYTSFFRKTVDILPFSTTSGIECCNTDFIWNHASCSNKQVKQQ